MDARNVVPLNKIIGVNLPVGIEHHSFLSGPLIILNRIIFDFFRQSAELILKGNFPGITSKNQISPDTDCDVMQRPFVKIESFRLVEPGRSFERAIQPVNPVMVGTADRFAVTATLLEQFGATMPAVVSKTA